MKSTHGFRLMCPYCKERGMFTSNNGDRYCLLCSRTWNEFEVKQTAILKGRKLTLDFIEKDKKKMRGK